MIHKIENFDQCTKEQLILYIEKLYKEIDCIATCNQSLQNIVDRYRALTYEQDEFYNNYKSYARHTNVIQSLEDKIILSEQDYLKNDISIIADALVGICECECCSYGMDDALKLAEKYISKGDK